MTIRIITESGAIYFLTGNRVTGGSKNLKNGKLLSPVQLGHPLLISTPERAHLNPHYKLPSVLSTHVVEFEPVEGDVPCRL